MKNTAKIIIGKIIIAALFAVLISSTAFAQQRMCPICVAAIQGELDEVRRLIMEGANVNNVVPGNGDTPLHRAVRGSGPNQIPIMNALLDAGANVNAPNARSGDTPLHVAVRANGILYIPVLLGRGARLDLFNNVGLAPLHVAVLEENAAAIAALMVANANLDIRSTNSGITPLHIAAFRGHADIINLLIMLGADVNAQSNMGNTPLHEAAASDETEIINTLAEAGADLNLKDDNGYTPLHVAAGEGFPDSVVALINSGADVNVENDNGETPLELARTAMNPNPDLLPEIIENLEKAAAAANASRVKKAEDAAVAFGYGGIVLFLAALYYDGGLGDLSSFSFTPNFGYSITESGYVANAGGKMRFQKENWDLYWTATQTNENGTFGELRYESGGEYKTDFWKAAFSESVSGETADYNFALSANFGGGVWKVSPTYRISSRFDETDSGILESETRNSLNLESELIWNRWTIKPTAGFNWQNERDFAENAKFRINAVHRF